MSKYINADELKEKLEKEYRSKHYSDYIDGRNNMIDVVKRLIDEMSPANVAEIIICKDCWFYDVKRYDLRKYEGFCYMYHCIKNENGFCNVGIARKEIKEIE